MQIVTYRGESSVGEMLDRVYTRLTPELRKKAEIEFLRVNPELNAASEPAIGTILRLPDIPELSAKRSRRLKNPETQIADSISDSLDDYESRLDDTISSAKEQIKQQNATLKSAAFKRQISGDENLQALANEAAKALSERNKAMDTRKKLLDQALKQVRKDLRKDFR